ncbi:uncharacterized protein LOC144610643 [Rhinoraja longicauda]
MAGGFGLVILASCLLTVSSCNDSKKTMVVLHHNESTLAEERAVCPTMCRCYVNILSCHPEKPLGSHAHDDASVLGTKAPQDASRNNITESTGNDTLTQVPKGIRGTMSGNVLTPFTVLDFRDNNISFVWKDSWFVYPSVEYLFLSHNSIRFIADYMFQPTPEIELIDISNNKLFAIQRDLFRTKHGLRFLKVLDLSNNNILVLGPGAFTQLSSLHFLNVSDNYLSLIGKGAFDHLDSVIYLDLRATSISLDILKGILESTTNIVNLYISHTLKCCLCKFPHLDKLILTRNVEINCKNIVCTISLIQCYTKEVQKSDILKDKERIIEEMEAVKAGTVSSLPGEKKNTETSQNKLKLERSRNPAVGNLNSTQTQPELGLEILNKDLQLGDKQADMKEELSVKGSYLKDKIKSEQSARDADRQSMKQTNLVKLSSKSERPALPDNGNEANTLGRLQKLKEALKSLYHYASDRIANNGDEQYRVILES